MNEIKPPRPLLSLAGRTTLQFWVQIALQLAAFFILKYALQMIDPAWTHEGDGPMLQITLMFCIAVLVLLGHLIFLLVRRIRRCKHTSCAPMSADQKFGRFLLVLAVLLGNFLLLMLFAQVSVHPDALPECFKNFGQEVKL